MYYLRLGPGSHAGSAAARRPAGAAASTGAAAWGPRGATPCWPPPAAPNRAAPSASPAGDRTLSGEKITASDSPSQKGLILINLRFGIYIIVGFLRSTVRKFEGAKGGEGLQVFSTIKYRVIALNSAFPGACEGRSQVGRILRCIHPKEGIHAPFPGEGGARALHSPGLLPPFLWWPGRSSVPAPWEPLPPASS
jgi:hypothetical protein